MVNPRNATSPALPRQLGAAIVFGPCLLSGCAPVSNDVVRTATATEAPATEATNDTATPSDTAAVSDPVRICRTVFEDDFDDEHGVDPPSGWSHEGTNPTPFATEADGTVSIEADRDTTRIIATGHAPLDLGTQPTRLDVRFVAFEAVDHKPIASVFFTSDTSLNDSFEVHFFSDQQVKVNTHSERRDNVAALFFGTHEVVNTGAFAVTLWFDDEHFQLTTDTGFDSGPVAFSSFANGFSPANLTAVYPALNMANQGSAGASRLEVDAIQVRTGPDCTIGDAQ